MKSELIPLDGSDPIPITRDLTLVGRKAYCDIAIDHPSLSKRHCVLVRTDGLLIVRDLASTNGTKVNGQKVMWAALLPNDKLTMGRMKFKVYLGPDEAPSPSELGRRHAPASALAVASEPSGSAVASAPVGFATPSPVELPALPVSNSTDPDSDSPSPPADPDGLEILDDLPVLDDDEDEPLFVMELD